MYLYTCQFIDSYPWHNCALIVFSWPLELFIVSFRAVFIRPNIVLGAYCLSSSTQSMLFMNTDSSSLIHIVRFIIGIVLPTIIFFVGCCSLFFERNSWMAYKRSIFKLVVGSLGFSISLWWLNVVALEVLFCLLALICGLSIVLGLGCYTSSSRHLTSSRADSFE